MKVLETLEKYKDALLELIYPSVTIHHICEGPIPFISDHHCIKCSLPLRMIEDGPICQECKNNFYFFDRAISVVKYEGDIKKLIYKFKYSSHTYLARIMGTMMADKLKIEYIEADLIIPVPLHKNKEKERGFNQAALLGKYIAKETDILLNTDTLVRVKNTKVMHNLNKKERQENVKDAFKVIDKRVIKKKNIILVDDIFTTGATVNTCSRLLIESGAKSVTVLTFARD